MREHVRELRLCAMCRVLGVHHNGYCVWLSEGASARDREAQRLAGPIKHFWLASGGVYGHRKAALDRREAGEVFSRHRVLRQMEAARLHAQAGYGSKPRHRGGPVGLVENVLDRNFTLDAPDPKHSSELPCRPCGRDRLRDVPRSGAPLPGGGF